jgi:catechol 2,3-dioxygenase-like lactoylglutathione lyase family enzyme
VSETRLILLVLEVENLAASLAFYRNLIGIPLVEDKDHGGGDRWISGEQAALSWGGSFLHFALYQSKGAVTRDVQIGFPTDDLAAAHSRLTAAGVPVSHGPRDEPWGATARYRDPDGNSVSLTLQTRRGA